jgi:ABC-type uncharacterized transport system ATPase subunit
MNIEFIGIHKSFGSVHANNDIHFKVPGGTIQGILGENGAGKSTLMKILSGFILPDRGKILLDGKDFHIHNPADAIYHGIGMLHQDPLDFPPMKVIDNLIIGSRKKSIVERFIPDRNSTIRQINKLQDRFGFNLDHQAYVDSLTVGERQQLEILRLIWLGAQVLIFDEPTTGISAPQKVKLFEVLRQLAAEGMTILFVSHKLEDIEQLCHRAVILRMGDVAGEVEAPFQINELITMMFGKIVEFPSRLEPILGDQLLQLKNVNIEEGRITIKNANLTVQAGEVIGLAGMEGSGQLSFLKACAGLIRPTSGEIIVNNRSMTGKNYHAFQKVGVTYLPAARLEEGLIPGLSLSEHFSLVSEEKGFLINQREVNRTTHERIIDFNIRGIPQTPVEELSGGNQQRALLALMQTNLTLISMEHPTRGLDVDSSIYIWNKLKERCSHGTSILFISSDLEEILIYSHRILVFFAGKVSNPLPAITTSIEELGELIGGKGWNP